MHAIICFLFGHTWERQTVVIKQEPFKTGYLHSHDKCIHCGKKRAPAGAKGVKQNG